MKKDDFIELSALLVDVAEYLDGNNDDLSLEPEELMSENPDMAPSTNVHRGKDVHRNTVFGLADYISRTLEGEESEFEGTEPLVEGERLEVYQDMGSYVFYDGSEKILKHGSKLNGSKKLELLDELADGRSYEDVHPELYEDATALSQTHVGLEDILDDEGCYMKQEYRQDISLFVDRLTGTPVAD